MYVVTKVRPPIFFSENIITMIMKFAYSMAAAITNLRLFFHKIFFRMNMIFPHLPQTLYAGRVKVFAEASEFSPLAVFQFVVDGKTSSLRSFFQGAKKMEVVWYYIGNIGRMREKNCRIGTSERKVMASLFWVSEKILLVEF